MKENLRKNSFVILRVLGGLVILEPSSLTRHSEDEE